MSKSESYKRAIIEIIEESKQNPDFANELMDILFADLDTELEARLNFQQIHSSLTDINAHLAVVSSRHIDEATNYYKELTNGALRNAMISYSSKYLQAIMSNNFPSACKFLFQQIETFASYLLFKKNLIDKALIDVKFIDKHKIKRNKAGGVIIPLYAKLLLISDAYRTEFGKLSIPYRTLNEFSYHNKLAYDACYDLRNYDSHGIIFNKSEASLIDLQEFQDNYIFYTNVPLSLIEYLLFVCIQVQTI